MSHYLGRIFVGWISQPREDAAAIMPRFEANKGTKDEEKQLQQIQDKQAKFMAEATSLPLFSKLASVVLVDPASDSKQTFPMEGSKEPIAVQIKDWLLANKDYYFASAKGICPFEFIGFAPREFVKLLGMECAEAEQPLPDCCWVGVSNYKDIESIVLGDLQRYGVTLDAALTRFGIAEHFKINLPYVPSKDPEEDLKITLELATRMGMMHIYAEEPAEA